MKSIFVGFALVLSITATNAEPLSIFKCTRSVMKNGRLAIATAREVCVTANSYDAAAACIEGIKGLNFSERGAYLLCMYQGDHARALCATEGIGDSFNHDFVIKACNPHWATAYKAAKRYSW